MSDYVEQVRVDIVVGNNAGAVKADQVLNQLRGKATGLGAANDNLAGSFGRVDRSLAGAGKSGGALATIFDDIKGRVAGVIPAIGGLVSQLGQLGPQAAIIGAVALGIGAIGSKAIEAASKVEIWKANLLTITGSSQKAEESYAALVAFANKTPFDTAQAVEGFTKLRTLERFPADLSRRGIHTGAVM